MTDWKDEAFANVRPVLEFFGFSDVRLDREPDFFRAEAKARGVEMWVTFTKSEWDRNTGDARIALLRDRIDAGMFTWKRWVGRD